MYTTRVLMKKNKCNLNGFALFYSCVTIFLIIFKAQSYAQEGSYSLMAQRILDDQNSFNTGSTTSINVFKFSINDVLNSLGETVENANGDPTIFGRTDYGSEFSLKNDLSTSFNVEIPAFVINDLAENDSGEFFPVIKNGNSDAEDGTYVNTYTDNALGTQVTEYFNSGAPDKIKTIYDYGTTEIEYLSDSGIDAKDHIYQDGSVYKSFFIDDELDVLASTYAGSDGYTSRYFVDPDSKYSYSTNNNVDGSIYTSFYDGSNASYSQTVNADNEITSSYYYDDGISLSTFTNNDGTRQTTFSNSDNDGSGNFKTIVENRTQTNTITNLQYTDQDNTTPIEFTLDSVTDTGVVVTQTFKSDSTALNIVKTNTGGNIKIVYGGEDIFEYLASSKDNLVNQAPDVIANGENVISKGLTTINNANNAKNPNRLAIDFKEVYDREDGLAVTPEMGFVKLNSADDNQYINLSDGDIVEFFVRPSDTYLENHNGDNLFFIDRPVPENPVVTDTDADTLEYNTADSSSSENENTIYVGPGQEAVTLPSGEIKIYVTTVYVQAPASKFLPSQVVMPIESDGDYNYDVEPAPAETFPDEALVVAIPEEEAKVLSEKVKELKRKKEEPNNPKHDEDAPPALEPEIEAMIKLNIILNDVQKGPSKLLSETKKNIQKEFPNISDQLVELFINTANSTEKFNLIRDPKEFLDNEFAKISDPIELNLLLSSDLSQEDLIKIYNLILYKFSTDLNEIGFEKLGNQEIDFSVKVKNAEQILERVQLQEDLMAIASLLGSSSGNQGFPNLLIEPSEVDPNSSNALFESSESQKVLDRIKRFSEVITSINSRSTVTNDSDQMLDDTLPVVEVNVGLGESIAEALEEKLAEDKRLNRSFQPRTVSSKLEQFNFEFQPQDSSSEPPTSISILANNPNISANELQIIAETTEATNNIINETITKMLAELGDDPSDDGSIQSVSAANDFGVSDQESEEISEPLVFGNALSSAQKLQQVEDIRATFEILGIGS